MKRNKQNPVAIIALSIIIFSSCGGAVRVGEKFFVSEAEQLAARGAEEAAIITAERAAVKETASVGARVLAADAAGATISNIETASVLESVKAAAKADRLISARESERTVEQLFISNQISETEKLLSTSALGKQLLEDRCFLTDHELSENSILQLANNGFSFIANRNFVEEYISVKRFKFIIVGSDDVTEMERLYEVNYRQAKKIQALYRKLPKTERISFVGNATELKMQIEINKSNNIQSFLIHNNSDGKVFGIDASEYKYDYSLTCNSFTTGRDEIINSTNELSIGSVVRSLSSCYYEPNLAGFYLSFFKAYKKDLMRQANKQIIFYSSGIFTTSSGMGYIIYSNKNNT